MRRGGRRPWFGPRNPSELRFYALAGKTPSEGVAGAVWGVAGIFPAAEPHGSSDDRQQRRAFMVGEQRPGVDDLTQSAIRPRVL